MRNTKRRALVYNSSEVTYIERSLIYAIDFDGTLCRNKWPDIGEPNTELIEYLIRKQKEGATLILWTMREGALLNRAVEWCAMHGLRFDAVNDNPKSRQEYFGNNPRKVYADVYIDDHNAGTTVIWN